MYFNKKLTRGWALDRVHNSRRCRLCARWALSQRHLTAPHGCLVATFLTLWPWPLTFWPSINWWARYHDGLSLCQVWRFNFSLFGLLCGQTDRQTDRITAVGDRYTHATTVGVSKDVCIPWTYVYMPTWCLSFLISLFDSRCLVEK